MAFEGLRTPSFYKFYSSYPRRVGSVTASPTARRPTKLWLGREEETMELLLNYLVLDET